MEPTGARRTKLGTKLYSESKETSRPRAARSNAIAKLAYSIVGSSAAYRLLDTSERIRLREIATAMYESGLEFEVAKQKQEVDKRGFVYVITHPAFPGYVKIGRAFDPASRLRGYQTGCPTRSYKLNHAVYFHDCYHAEKEMHLRLSSLNETGEWFRLTADQATNFIDHLREVL